MSNNGKGKTEDLEEHLGEEDQDLNTELNDEARQELDGLVELKVLGIELWETAEEEGEEPTPPEEQALFDCDIFMEEDLALELYAAAAYRTPEDDPITGIDRIFEVVGRLSDEKMELIDFDQADDEGGLAVAFGKGDKVELVLVASAWIVSEWEESDEEEEEDEDEDEDEDE